MIKTMEKTDFIGKNLFLKDYNDILCPEEIGAHDDIEIRSF